MIASMTGYGDAQRSMDRISYVIEIRCLNNRYYKGIIKLPEGLQALEADVDRILRERLSRGTVTFTLRIRNESETSACPVNTAALSSYLRSLQQVSLPEGVAGTVDLASLLLLPGVCQNSVDHEEARGRHWAVIREMLEEAVNKVVEMRKQEGQTLRADLLGQCDQLALVVDEIELRAPVVIREYEEKLRKRVESLLKTSSLELGQEDLRREVAVYADRCDITEEMVRLRSHLDQFRTICDSSEPAGRKLDFLSQELFREANTISSKSSDSVIAHRSVEMKSIIDRIKEQVQNVQ